MDAEKSKGKKSLALLIAMGKPKKDGEPDGDEPDGDEGMGAAPGDGDGDEGGSEGAESAAKDLGEAMGVEVKDPAKFVEAFRNLMNLV